MNSTLASIVLVGATLFSPINLTAQTKPTTEKIPSTQVQPVKESKSAEETEAAGNQKETQERKTDPLTVLRDQINAATGAERIRLELKLADELLAAGKTSDAIAELHSVTSSDVFDPPSFYNAGNSLARLGDNEAAIEGYKKAIDQRKGGYSRALNNLGVVLLRLGRWDESYEALWSALKWEHFRYPEASYNLGRLYAARGQNDLAVREWRRVLAIDPNHAAAAAAIARLGSEEVAIVQPSRVASTSAESSGPLKPTNISERAPRTLILDPISFDLLQRARTFTEKGNAEASVDSYERLLSRKGGYLPVANLELSFALFSLKRYDEALSNLQLVANRDGSRYPISYFHLARVYELKGDLKQAETFFSQSVSAFGTKNSQFLLDVSRVREKQGDFKGALEALERYLTLMQQQGQAPSWSDERLTALRQKVAKPE